MKYTTRFLENILHIEENKNNLNCYGCYYIKVQSKLTNFNKRIVYQ